MNWEQLKGIVERIATVGVTYAIGRGWIPAGLSADLVALIVLAGSVAWGWKVNTPVALATAAKEVR